MAKTPVVVTEEDYKADPDNVQKIETRIPGFPDAEPLLTYVKVQHVDDLTAKPAEGIETVPLLVPVEKEREEVVLGEDGEPEKNDDGSEKLHVVKYWDFEPRELDLSAPSLKKLVTALKPFAEKSRERVVALPSARPVAAAAGANPARTEWLRKVRDWALNTAPAGQLGGWEPKEKGRIPDHVQAAYVKSTGDAKPE
ncbi:hypothetical protein [Streptomyces sp. LARHCF252]